MNTNIYLTTIIIHRCIFFTNDLYSKTVYILNIIHNSISISTVFNSIVFTHDLCIFFVTKIELYKRNYNYLNICIIKIIFSNVI